MRHLHKAFVLVICGSLAHSSLHAGDPAPPRRHDPRPEETAPATVWTEDLQTFARHLDDLHDQVEE